MQIEDLSVLPVLLATAEERSFSKAAKRLNVSPSAVSHAIRGLEERLGVRLLSRTTRSVAPTEAGEQLLARLRPAFQEVRAGLDEIAGFRDRPVGRVRLLLPRYAAMSIVAPKLAEFVRRYPDVLLDVTTDDNRMDIVAGGFDAGIHLGEFIQKDMIAVRVSGDQRAAIVGAPSYFATRRKPKSPRELTQHSCINFRHGSGGAYRWEFEKGRKSLSVGVHGPLILDDVPMVIRAGLDGVGLAFLGEDLAAPYLGDGRLVRVLEGCDLPPISVPAVIRI